eukprot:2749769-Lingulodinium_polyedra.AAC.1
MEMSFGGTLTMATHPQWPPLASMNSNGGPNSANGSSDAWAQQLGKRRPYETPAGRVHAATPTAAITPGSGGDARSFD